MLRLRVLTGIALGVLLLAGLFLLPAPLTVLAFGAVLALGAWEWARFGGLLSVTARLLYAATLAALWALAWVFSANLGFLLVLLSLACAWWAIAFLWLTLAPERHRAGLALLAGVPVLVPAFVALARLEVGRRAQIHGPEIVLCLILLVVAADVGAFFAGRAFGRHKLAPRVSPGKTWEGLAGGLTLVALVSWLVAWILGLPAMPSVGFGCAVGVFSVIGDLTESLFKRGAGLKDSGRILPGHGGVLDRIDSVTAAAPLYALGLFSSGVVA